MKKLWPTLIVMALTAAIAVGICTSLRATRPVLPDGAQARVKLVLEVHGAEDEDRTGEVDSKALADCLALMRCRKRPFSRKAGIAPTDCYEIMFDLDTGRAELYVLYLDWNGGGYFYDISTTSSYALDDQGDDLREIVDRMLEQ